MATVQNNKPTPKPVAATTAKKDETKLTPEERKAINTDRFKKIASGRTTAIVKNLRLLENCVNKNVYEYTPEQVEKMFVSIDTAVKRLKEKFEEKKAEAAPVKVSL